MNDFELIGYLFIDAIEEWSSRPDAPKGSDKTHSIKFKRYFLN